MTKLSVLWLVVCSLFVILGPGSALGSDLAGSPPSCSTEITSCGCVITHANTYTVANDLSAGQTDRANCIEIAADHSILNLKGFSVIGNGNGTGTGILIRHGADHVVVQGADETQQLRIRDDDPCAPSGHQAIVNRWNVAIEDDAEDAVIELFDGLGGNASQPSGNATAGILMNNGNRSVAGDFIACYNGVAGVLVKNSSGSTLFNFTSNSNQAYGVWLDSSNDSRIGTASVGNNGSYGVWLMRSSRNVIDNYGASQNGDTGTLIGCGTVHCTGNETSDNNRVTNGGNNGNTMAGLVIQKHNRNNIITITTNGGNPDGHDMVDLNANCDRDIWYNNTGTSNQSCIH